MRTDPERVLDELLVRLRDRLTPVLQERARHGRPLLDRSLDETVTAMAAPLPLSSPWDDAIGPFYNAAGVGALLGVSRQAVHQQRTQRRLLAVSTRDERILYPAFQFGPDRRALPGWPEVLSQVPVGVIDSWTLASWLRTARLPELDDRSVVDWLSVGGDAQPAVLAVRRAAARWAA